MRGKELKGSVVSSNVIFISYHNDDELNMEDLVLVLPEQAQQAKPAYSSASTAAHTGTILDRDASHLEVVPSVTPSTT